MIEDVPLVLVTSVLGDPPSDVKLLTDTSTVSLIAIVHSRRNPTPKTLL